MPHEYRRVRTRVVRERHLHVQGRQARGVHHGPALAQAGGVYQAQEEGGREAGDDQGAADPVLALRRGEPRVFQPDKGRTDDDERELRVGLHRERRVRGKSREDGGHGCGLCAHGSEGGESGEEDGRRQDAHHSRHPETY